MANKTKKLDLKTVKPGEAAAFNPVHEVDQVEARAKSGGDYIYARLKPAGGGADVVGTVTLRMPASLAPGTPLAWFAKLVGQDPNKGFDLEAAHGQRIALTFQAQS